MRKRELQAQPRVCYRRLVPEGCTDIIIVEPYDRRRVTDRPRSQIAVKRGAVMELASSQLTTGWVDRIQG